MSMLDTTLALAIIMSLACLKKILHAAERRSAGKLGEQIFGEEPCAQNAPTFSLVVAPHYGVE
jgi:hypothetical protein